MAQRAHWAAPAHAAARRVVCGRVVKRGELHAAVQRDEHLARSFNYPQQENEHLFQCGELVNTPAARWRSLSAVDRAELLAVARSSRSLSAGASQTALLCGKCCLGTEIKRTRLGAPPKPPPLDLPPPPPGAFRCRCVYYDPGWNEWGWYHCDAAGEYMRDMQPPHTTYHGGPGTYVAGCKQFQAKVAQDTAKNMFFYEFTAAKHRQHSVRSRQHNSERSAMKVSATLMVSLRRLTLALAAHAGLVDMDTMTLIGTHVVGRARHFPTLVVTRRFNAQGWAFRAHQTAMRALNACLVPLVRRGDVALAAGRVAEALGLFEEALLGYRVAGRERPKLAQKILTVAAAVARA